LGVDIPTPPKCFVTSVLATLHAAFARKVRARPSGFSNFGAIWVYCITARRLAHHPFSDGFVNRLQDAQFPSFLLFKLRGLDFYPRWDSHPLFMPAFAGRTHIGANLLRMPRARQSSLALSLYDALIIDRKAGIKCQDPAHYD